MFDEWFGCERSFGFRNLGDSAAAGVGFRASSAGAETSNGLVLSASSCWELSGGCLMPTVLFPRRERDL